MESTQTRVPSSTEMGIRSGNAPPKDFSEFAGCGDSVRLVTLKPEGSSSDTSLAPEYKEVGVQVSLVVTKNTSSTKEREWYILWSAPNQRTSNYLRLFKHEGNDHWTNYGVLARYYHKNGTEISLGVYDKQERDRWVEIANKVGVKWEGGEWYGPETWARNVLDAAVKEGLLTEEKKEEVLKEAEKA